MHEGLVQLLKPLLLFSIGKRRWDLLLVLALDERRLLVLEQGIGGGKFALVRSFSTWDTWRPTQWVWIRKSRFR